MTLGGCHAPLERFVFTEPVMGVEARITLFARNPEHAESAAQAAFRRLHQLDRTLSNYRPESELSQLPSVAIDQPVAVSDDLGRILGLADELHQQSDGAFDITIGPVAKIWKDAIRAEAAPDEATLQQAWSRVGWHRVHYSAVTSEVRLEDDEVRLDPGGLGKGDAADEVVALLRSLECGRCLVDVGGDLAMGDAPPDRAGWRLRVSDDAGGPDAMITVVRCGVATSGATHQHLVIDGRRFSHLLDPRTRRPVSHDLTVTVIAPTAAMADGLASIVSVVGVEAGLRLIESLPNVECRIIDRDVVHQSTGFGRLVATSH